MTMFGATRNMNFSPAYDKANVVELKNKFDAFRLFKTLCEDFGYDDFCIFDTTHLGTNFCYEKAMVLHTLGDISISLLDGHDDTMDDPFIQYLNDEIRPRQFNRQEFDEHNIPQLLVQLEMNVITAIPVSSISGCRYAVAFLGNKKSLNEDSGDIGLLMMRTIDAFQNFFKAVLSKELSAEFNEREIAIIQMTADGKTSVEIAKTLSISEHTVNSNMASMLKMMNANNRAHLITLAIKRGIIQ